MPSKHTFLLLVGLGVIAGLLLMPLPGHWRGIWQSKLFDLGHVPLFAALTWLLWRLCGPNLITPVMLAIAIAGLAELAQQLVGRSGSWLDFVNGACGALAAGTGLWAWQSLNPSSPAPLPLSGSGEKARRPLQGALGLLLVTAGVAWPVYDAAPYLVDACEGAEAFPTLADFRTSRELLRWRTRQAELTRVERDGAWAGRLHFLPGDAPDPYGALRPIRRDFTEYRWLCCAFDVEGGPLELVISIRSGSGDLEETTHYQEMRRYSPGANVVRLDLPAVAPKANPRPLDLTDVWIIQFFLEQPRTPRTIHLQRVWLEK